MSYYYSKRPQDRLFDYLLIVLMIAFSITILYPFICEISKSFSSEAHIMVKGYTLLPGGFTIENWKTIFRSSALMRAFFNTVFVTVMASAYSLFLSVTYAYPLSRRDLPKRNFFTFALVFTMFFSGGLIPSYILSYKLGLVNTLTVLIVGGVSAWNTIIIRNFFMAVPASLQESARIDGASEADVLTRIMLPLSMPVLATVTLWNMVGAWISWVGPMIYIRNPDKQTLQIMLRQLLFQNVNLVAGEDPLRLDTTIQLAQKTVEGLKSATLIFVIIPIIITYPFLQKYFVKGILMGSLKG
jgi:putative aldouronate transport system permease protein